MLDVRLIREEPGRVKEAARRKGLDRDEEVDRLVEADRRLREILPAAEGLRAGQKEAGKRMASLSGAQRQEVLAEQRSLKEELLALEAREKELRAEVERLMLLMPNLPSADVPEGKTADDNVEVRRRGEPPRLPFPPRGHLEIAEALDLVDVVRAGRVAGSRNYYLKGDLVLLQEAVLRMALEHMVARGFTPLDPPLLVRDAAMVGTAYYPGGEEQAYRIEKDQLNLIGTSEVPVTSFHAGEILEEDQLPVRYVARSLCFRREAGTYGKDTKGLFRVHQFQKVEQVVVDVDDEERSLRHHHEILQYAEDLLVLLELPYRVVNVCGGDLGVPQVQKFDIECWMPSREGWGETHSASRFHDFQARRLGLRYRAKADRRVRFCHTLNNTVVASPRILIPLLEVHQQEDGSVRLPQALRPYMGGRDRLGPPARPPGTG